jgi:hypothetical protein
MKRNITDITKVAQLCHNMNKAWCEFNGDSSQPTWEDTPKTIQDSAIAGVITTLGLINSDIDTPSISQALHDQWAEYKTNEGWVYGEEKNIDKKTHPCLVDFSQLPKADRIKDEVFVFAVCVALDLESENTEEQHDTKPN